MKQNTIEIIRLESRCLSIQYNNSNTFLKLINKIRMLKFGSKASTFCIFVIQLLKKQYYI